MTFSGYCPRFIRSPDTFTSVFFLVQLFCCPATLLRISSLRPWGPTGFPWGHTASLTLGQALPGSSRRARGRPAQFPARSCR